jgi:hypothetical protein
MYNVPNPEQLAQEQAEIEAVTREEIEAEADRIRTVDIPGHGPEACEQ